MIHVADLRVKSMAIEAGNEMLIKWDVQAKAPILYPITASLVTKGQLHQHHLNDNVAKVPLILS